MATMRELTCTRASFSNKTCEIYEVDKTYVVDIENPRTVKFFAYPEDDKEAQALKKQHLALFKAEKAAKLKKAKAKPAAEEEEEPDGAPNTPIKGKGKGKGVKAPATE
jgi:hypothetical protein